MHTLMMKAWLETRARFYAAALVLTVLGVSTVARAPATINGWEAFHRGEQMSYALYIWLSLSHGFLQFLWVVSAVVLGLGGLMRERAAGTSGFTLALPTGRSAHVAARAFVGALEAIVLGFIPGLFVVVLSPLAGFRYPLSQAVLFGALLVSAGLVFYAFGFFLSHLLHGEYAPPGVALATIAAFYILTKLPRLEHLNVFDAMDGKQVLIGQTFYLGETYPVGTIIASLICALSLIVLSVWRATAEDF